MSCADLVLHLYLELPEHRHAAQQHGLTSLARKSDEFRATVSWVWDALDGAHLFELVNELADRLLGDADALGQVGQARALHVDVWEQIGMGRAEGVGGHYVELNFPRTETLAKEKGQFARIKRGRIVRVDRKNLLENAEIGVGIAFE